jgi:hypothetical protein
MKYRIMDRPTGSIVLARLIGHVLYRHQGPGRSEKVL